MNIKMSEVVENILKIMINIVLMKRQNLSNIWKSVSILIDILQAASGEFLVTTIPKEM